MIGFIGGSGLYEIEDLEDTRWVRISTPWGKPSDAILQGRLDGVDVAFLPRHGRGHPHAPGSINYRANIDALKQLGATDVISLSACGSFREELPPGTFVIVDQFIDRTMSRKSSFFGEGLVAHVSMAHPVCERLGDHVEAVLSDQGGPHRRGGTYLAMEGPQFSTRAESESYRRDGLDVIGMTNMPEAKLAREAELCYQTIAMVTDFDCWHPDHDHVQVETILEVLTANAGRARALVRALTPRLAQRPGICPGGCDRVLDTALITAPDARDPARVEKLAAVAGRVLS